MQQLWQWPERTMQRVRWLLLIGWIGLILSLLMPAAGLNGNGLFWGSVVPGGLLIIAAVSHELWRRICPLAFISQLARALNRQRRTRSANGRLDVVKIRADSWLGQHHVQLQWTLLIAGLCLRLLAVNNSAMPLAMLLLGTVAAALAVGWAFGGKAWCQYVCPMGPVQQVLTGLRGPLGQSAHLNAGSRITQSMCRTLSSDGREQSACVACQSACIDIDSERSFWTNLQGKRGLDWAWGSYPGLILAFFLLLGMDGSGSAETALLPIAAGLDIPRLIAVPVLLSGAGFASAWLHRRAETLLSQRYRHNHRPEAEQRARQHVRLLWSWVAINLFFWFANPLQGLFGITGHHLLRSALLLATGLGLARSWSRTEGTYRRENSSTSLRRQLQAMPGLEKALDGRSLDALQPEEVFTLVKAIPAIGNHNVRRIYSDVMRDMLETGRLSQASALVELDDLRNSLGLSRADHHAVLALLQRSSGLRLDGSLLEQEASELRCAAARERIEELMRVSGLEVIDRNTLSPTTETALERLRQSSGLSDDAWENCLENFGPASSREQHRLLALHQDWQRLHTLQRGLSKTSESEPLLRPLAQVLRRQLELLTAELAPAWATAQLPPLVEPRGGDWSRDEAMDLLWQDPSAATASWALMVEQQRGESHAERLKSQPRIDRESSAFLEGQIQGQRSALVDACAPLLEWELFSDMTPADFLWLAQQGCLRHYAPGEVVIQKGEASTFLTIVVKGSVEVATSHRTIPLGWGKTIGEMGVITGQPRSATVMAGPQEVTLFQIPSEAFEDLLQRSPQFNRGLLRELAERINPELAHPEQQRT